MNKVAVVFFVNGKKSCERFVSVFRLSRFFAAISYGNRNIAEKRLDDDGGGF